MKFTTLLGLFFTLNFSIAPAHELGDLLDLLDSSPGLIDEHSHEVLTVRATLIEAQTSRYNSTVVKLADLLKDRQTVQIFFDELVILAQTQTEDANKNQARLTLIQNTVNAVSVLLATHQLSNEEWNSIEVRLTLMASAELNVIRNLGDAWLQERENQLKKVQQHQNGTDMQTNYNLFGHNSIHFIQQLFAAIARIRLDQGSVLLDNPAVSECSQTILFQKKWSRLNDFILAPVLAAATIMAMIRENKVQLDELRGSLLARALPGVECHDAIKFLEHTRLSRWQNGRARYR